MLILLLAHCVRGVGADDDALVSTIRSAAAANRAAFTRGTAHFLDRRDDAKDARRAGQGDWTPWGTARGVFAFDGKRGRFERIYPVEDTVARRRPAGGGSYTSSLVSVRVLTDGTATLWDQVGVASDDRTVTHAAQIADGPEAFYREVMFPLDLHDVPGSPSELENDFVRAGTAGTGWKLKEIDEHATLDGVSVARLTFAGGGFRRDYLIDLEHGAIVRRRSDLSEQGDLRFQLDQDDVRHVDGRGWFPYRMTVLMPGPSGCSVKELVVEDADFNSAPAADVFRLEFPAPISMIHQGKMVRYDPQRVWDLAHLPSLSSGRANRFVLNQPSPPEPRMAGPRRQRWPFVVPAALIGLALLVVASSLYWRSRARG